MSVANDVLAAIDPERTPPESVRETGEQPIVTAVDPDGLVAAIAQDVETRQVLMMAWMNAESLAMTLSEGRMVYWSRSRQEVWRKGDTSGDRQYVREAFYDCDGDTLLVKVEREGPACHTGDRTCFDSRLLPAVVVDRAAR